MGCVKGLFRLTRTCYNIVESLNWRSSTQFLETYDGLSLYDIYMNNIYTFYHEEIRFVKKGGYAIVNNTDQSVKISMYHGYFSFVVIFLTKL